MLQRCRKKIALNVRHLPIAHMLVVEPQIYESHVPIRPPFTSVMLGGGLALVHHEET